MLAYAVESKLTIADDVIAGMVRAKNVLRQDAWTPDEEIGFWTAFTQLNATVKPVTVRSLKTVMPPPDGTYWQRTFTRGSLFLFIYSVCTFLLFLLVVSLQTYWFIGNGLIQEIEQLTTRQFDLLQVEQTIRQRSTETNDSNTILPEESRELLDITQKLQANYIGLLKWSVYWKLLLKDEHTFEGKNVLLNEKLTYEEISRLQRKIDTERGLLKNVNEDQRPAITRRITSNEHEKLRLNRELESERQRYKAIITKLPSQFVLEMLQSYILPMLYGLLGAAIYVLRAATREIDAVTYTMGSDIRYELRMALGALGGLAIGWFLVPEDFSGLLRTLSPLALSLAAGYNIEVLFSLMDSFIDNWTKSFNEASPGPDAP